MTVGVIVTGGTIAATRDDQGSGLFAPRCGSELLAMTEQIGRERGFDIEVTRWCDPAGDVMPLLDSSDVEAWQWCLIAQQVEGLLARCSGVVVLHGTDTLSYTAAALGLLAGRRSGPVVITGAQVPLVVEGSDAPGNLSAAIDAAAGMYGDLLGDTVVAFGGRVMRAVRVSKHSTEQVAGFHSWNCASMRASRGDPGSDVREHWQLARAGCTAAPLSDFVQGVVHLKVSPAMDMAWLERAMSAAPPAGLVFELYGVGSAPQARRFAEIANRLADISIPSVAVTACRHGGLDWQRYEATAPLRDSALIPGGDMTGEAAVVKLAGALAETAEVEHVRRRFAASIAAEMTI